MNFQSLETQSWKTIENHFMFHAGKLITFKKYSDYAKNLSKRSPTFDQKIWLLFLNARPFGASIKSVIETLIQRKELR